jgi:hypothetical protein
VRSGRATVAPGDYDGDGRFDLALAEDDGQWSIDYAANGFGAWDETYFNDINASYAVPADYDGDGKTDRSYKNVNGTWYIDYAANGFGEWDIVHDGYGADTIPVPADYDGDGRADLAVKSDFYGAWLIDYAATGFGVWDIEYDGFGGADQHPVPADYDGDCRADLSTKSDAGEWRIYLAANGFKNPKVYSGFGGPDYAPVPADYDGDGRVDLSTRDAWDAWFIDYARDGVGEPEWDEIRGGFAARDVYRPIPADYDGDGKADLASHTDDGGWFLDFASDGFGVWNGYWSSSLTISSSPEITDADLRMFDVKWMHPTRVKAEQVIVGNAMHANQNRTVWQTTDHMMALVRMYETTHQARYVDALSGFAATVMQYRDDRRTDRIMFDQIRGDLMLPAWGGSGPDQANLYAVDEAVSNDYAYAVAAFARVVAEDSALQATYGPLAIEYAYALLQTVSFFWPQVRSETTNGSIESYLAWDPHFGTALTKEACQNAGGSKSELNECTDAIAFGSSRLPLPYNINNKFAMLLIELLRVLDSPYYRLTSSDVDGAEAWRVRLAAFVAQSQRRFHRKLTPVDAPARFRWSYESNRPDGAEDGRADDTSHASVSFRYLGILNRDLERLNRLASASGEQVQLDASDLRMLANTFLFMTKSTDSVPANVHLAGSVAGEADSPMIDSDDYTCDGMLDLTATDPRVYDACHIMTFRAKDGVQPFLTVANHAALLANKRARYPKALGPDRAPPPVSFY